MIPRIETLAIGDELLTGRISDTNSMFVGETLFEQGFVLSASSVILDREEDILAAFELLASRASVVICFGGLGPTTDDLTVDTVCRWLGCDPVEHGPQAEKMIAVYKSRGRTVTPEAHRQVRYPSLATPFLNEAGLAPGFSVERNGCEFFFLPGVPKEMKPMVLGHVLPRVLEKFPLERLSSDIWRLIGIPESEVQGRLNGVQALLTSNAWLGYRTKYPENHVTLYSRGVEPQTKQNWVDAIEAAVGEWSYSRERNDSLEQWVMRRLQQTGKKIAFAESCTGGLAAHRLSQISHASDHLWGGTVVYQYEAKNRFFDLGLRSPAEAVSRECTLNLARSLLKFSGCDIAASVTGYMEPEEEDPNWQGQIYFAVVSEEAVVEGEYKLPLKNRVENQWGASSFVLHAVGKFLA